MASDYPARDKFARLTASEEKHGLYERPETIGTRDGWEITLRERGVRLAGHRLVKDKRRGA